MQDISTNIIFMIKKTNILIQNKCNDSLHSKITTKGCIIYIKQNLKKIMIGFRILVYL